MNLLVKKQRVLAILLASLFFVSCEDPGKLGLNINPDAGALTAKYKEFVLPTTMVQFNPRSTTNANSIQAGTYTTPDLGTVTTKSYFWLGVAQTTPTLSTSAKYKDAKITIQFFSTYGAPVTNDEVQSFDLYQLSQPLETGVAYTREDELATGDLLGSFDLNLQENDTLTTDSIFTFDLTDEFGQLIYDKLQKEPALFENDTVFNTYFNGVVLQPKVNNNKIVYFTVNTLKLSVNYTEVNSAGEVVDRTYSFDLGNTNFLSIKNDVTGTPLQGIMPDNSDFTPTNDYRYLQAGTMLALKLNYDSLFTLPDTAIVQEAFIKIGNLTLNKPGSGYPLSLIGYFTDDQNTWPAEATSSTSEDLVYATLQNDLTATGSQTSPPGYYGNTLNITLGQTDTLKFEVPISNFSQRIITGGFNTEETPLEQGGRLILYAPTSTTDPQTAPAVTQTNFFKVHKDSIKLQVYYSVPNQ